MQNERDWTIEVIKGQALIGDIEMSYLGETFYIKSLAYNLAVANRHYADFIFRLQSCLSVYLLRRREGFF